VAGVELQARPREARHVEGLEDRVVHDQADDGATEHRSRRRDISRSGACRLGAAPTPCNRGRSTSRTCASRSRSRPPRSGSTGSRASSGRARQTPTTTRRPASSRSWPPTSRELAHIDLFGVGIFDLTDERPLDSAANQISRLVAELYVERMAFVFPGIRSTVRGSRSGPRRSSARPRRLTRNRLPGGRRRPAGPTGRTVRRTCDRVSAAPMARTTDRWFRHRHCRPGRSARTPIPRR